MDQNIFNTILSLLVSFLSKGETQESNPIAAQAPIPVSAPAEGSVLDWNSPDCKLSNHFTVKEALWLPSWSRMANEADGLSDTIKANLIDLCKAMDIVRDHFGKPIRVHVTYRPLEYNKAIGGALHSAHSDGQAMDFDIIGMDCDAVRKELVDNGLLDTWQMRCEDAPGSNWVHLDRRALLPDGHRFFKP